jgi:ssDNA-binding Zn-finger/Zn-ribbon topoisomerase 1
MAKEMYEDLSEEKLNEFEEVKNFEVDEDSFKVSEGICPECSEKMDKIIENKNLFDGALTFHIIKYRCPKCKKEFMDLKQAEKYDFYLSLKKIKKPISYITQSLAEEESIKI